MVLDTSVVIAILLGEPDAPALIRALVDDPKRIMSAFSALESAVVLLGRKGPSGMRELDLLLHEANIVVVSFDDSQAALARTAYEEYGKGRHPAGLNLGDCCTYALARASGEPLLCKGRDFPQTDVPLVDVASVH